MNEWINVEDYLPKVGETVEIELENGEKIESGFIFEIFCGTPVFLFRRYEIVYNPIKWRKIPEKRPDFSKLKKGDLIFIEHDKGYERYDKIGFAKEISTLYMSLSVYKDISCSDRKDCSLDLIKKITRINLEEKTFEEI